MPLTSSLSNASRASAGVLKYTVPHPNGAVAGIVSLGVVPAIVAEVAPNSVKSSIKSADVVSYCNFSINTLPTCTEPG